MTNIAEKTAEKPAEQTAATGRPRRHPRRSLPGVPTAAAVSCWWR